MIKLTDILKEAMHDNTRIVKIAASTNKLEISKIRGVLKNAQWTDKEIDDAVKKRKQIDKKYQDQEDAKKSALDKKRKLIQKQKAKERAKGWTTGKYNRWVKDMSAHGGSNHGYDMARNSNQEPGLINFVKKQIRRNYGDESPLERIQWDIEAA